MGTLKEQILERHFKGDEKKLREFLKQRSLLIYKTEYGLYEALDKAELTDSSTKNRGYYFLLMTLHYMFNIPLKVFDINNSDLELPTKDDPFANDKIKNLEFVKKQCGDFSKYINNNQKGHKIYVDANMFNGSSKFRGLAAGEYKKASKEFLSHLPESDDFFVSDNLERHNARFDNSNMDYELMHDGIFKVIEKAIFGLEGCNLSDSDECVGQQVTNDRDQLEKFGSSSIIFKNKFIHNNEKPKYPPIDYVRFLVLPRGVMDYNPAEDLKFKSQELVLEVVDRLSMPLFEHICRCLNVNPNYEKKDSFDSEKRFNQFTFYYGFYLIKHPIRSSHFAILKNGQYCLTEAFKYSNNMRCLPSIFHIEDNAGEGRNVAEEYLYETRQLLEEFRPKLTRKDIKRVMMSYLYEFDVLKELREVLISKKRKVEECSLYTQKVLYFDKNVETILDDLTDVYGSLSKSGII